MNIEPVLSHKLHYTQSPSHFIIVVKTRQAMQVQHNTETRSSNHCCCGKAISVTYCECVFVVVLGIQHSMRMRYIVICCLPSSTVFIHIISLTARFSEKRYGI